MNTQNIKYQGSVRGLLVQFDTITDIGTVHSLLPPAQARELAAVLMELADKAEQFEGIIGQARRDALVHLDVQYLLPSQPK
jgi:hypothetical protein